MPSRPQRKVTSEITRDVFKNDKIFTGLTEAANLGSSEYANAEA